MSHFAELVLYGLTLTIVCLTGTAAAQTPAVELSRDSLASIPIVISEVASIGVRKSASEKRHAGSHVPALLPGYSLLRCQAKTQRSRALAQTGDGKRHRKHRMRDTQHRGHQQAGHAQGDQCGASQGGLAESPAN